MKASTHSGKGKSWGHPAKGSVKSDSTVGPSSGESHSGSPSSKFIGKTKGNSDLPPNRS